MDCKRAWTFKGDDGETYRIEIDFDMDAIADEMIFRCERSKYGRATKLKGAIKARVIPVVCAQSA
jgi:hypothetical protein